MSTDLLARADRLRAARTPFVLATVVRAERPTSAKAGDKAIVLADGTIEGFVGGVCAESTVRLEGLRLLEGGPSAQLASRPGGSATLLRITPTDEGAVSTETVPEGLVVVGNPCLSGGTLDIFLEAFLPATLLHVYGGAPIARALVTVAEAAGFAVTHATDPATPIAADTAAVVVASHGRDEEPVLEQALKAGVGYVGLIASRKRAAAVLSTLDVPDDLRGRVRSPAGLDIGARTPLEIAVSVVAELVAVRAGRDRHPGKATRQLLPMLDKTKVVDDPVARSGSVSTPDSVDQSDAATTAPTAIDPVCGMTVAAVPATLHLEHNGTTYYFCAPGCRKAFAADPARYGA
ncbi:MAG TPA: XdhC family protein [Micromonosporaceae bacterium]|nr:XdhC family protein [Micromonosporaceae bacterium]